MNKQRKTLAKMEEALNNASIRIIERTNDLLLNPNDAEALHQYRISIRITRSMIKFIEPYCKKDSLKELSAKLKWLQAPTSRIRELDVLVSSLPEGSPITAECCKARDKERKAFLKNFKRKSTLKALEYATYELEHIPWKRSVRKKGIKAKELAKRVKMMQVTCEIELKNLPFDDFEAIHDARKDAKALRYIAREFAACLPKTAGTTSSEAKAIQDRLGVLCDCRNNASLIMEICGAKGSEIAAMFVCESNNVIIDLKAAQ